MWSINPVPRNPNYHLPLATPKPDVHLGYPKASHPTWNTQEKNVLEHPKASPYAKPTGSNTFPFLVMELKSEVTGGTLWQAQNQAAGSGAHCVNSMRWFLREAYPSVCPSVLDTIAFSVVFNHREAIFHVHFYSEDVNMNVMSRIAVLQTMVEKDIQTSNDLIKNILSHGLGKRKTTVRNAISDLMPSYLERWNLSRPASVMDADEPEALAAGQGSNKSQRLE